MRRRRNPRGIALIWTAVMLFVLVGFVGLSIDWGKLAWNVGQMQHAADAAALAGAQYVKYDQVAARDNAVWLGLANVADNTSVSLDRNDSNADNGEVVLGYWNRMTRTFTARTTGCNAVKAVVRRAGQRADAAKLRLLFGPVFGTSEAEATRPAIAISLVSMGAGIICLAEHPIEYKDFGWNNFDTGFLRDGGCDVDLRGPDGWVGDIQINSVSVDGTKSAVVVNGTSGEIWAGEMNTCGTSNPEPTSDKWEGFYGDGEAFNVNPSMPRIEDPLGYLNDTPPNISAMDTYTCPDVSGGGTATIQPGWYPEGIDPKGGTIIMEPGVYAVGGGTKKSQISGLINSTGHLEGEGIMVYVTGDEANGIYYGKVDIGANSTTDLVSRGDAATPKVVDGEPGVVIWQDIDNHNMASITGGAGSSMIGTLYFPDAPVSLGGGPNEMGTQIIAGALHIHGNVTLGVAYDGRNFIRSNRSMLVD